MAKILKKEPKKQPDSTSTNAFLYTLGIIALIVALIVLVPKLYNPQPKLEDQYTYNYFEFVKKSGTWFTQAQVGDNLLSISLRHGPRQLEDVLVKGNIAGFRDSFSFYYITFDPRKENHDQYVTMSNAEISPNLVVHFGKDIEPACIMADEICTESNISIVTCDNTNLGVIFLNRAPGPGIEIRDNCAIITGQGVDMVPSS